MSKKLRLSHNLNDLELEMYLEKALKTVKNYQEPNRKYPDKIAEQVMDEATVHFDRVLSNMMSEIRKVVEEE